MIILTGANRDKPTNDGGDIRTDTKFTFSAVIKKTMKKATELGYFTDVYDLGQLGFGRPFQVGEDSFFAEHGYYEKEAIKGYKSKSLFKPKLVKACIAEHQDITVYLDGDAQLCGDLSAADTNDYDVGVTLRHSSELEGEWHQHHFEIAKYVNAGVIFFRPTPATDKFLDRWDTQTDELGNDQMALNKLACPDYYPEAGSVLEIDGVRIKYFPGEIYNFYHFMELKSASAKVMHFKGVVRTLYPFGWKERLYCKLVILVKGLKNLLSKKKEPT